MTLMWAEPAKMVQQWNTEQLWHRIEARQRPTQTISVRPRTRQPLFAGVGIALAAIVIAGAWWMSPRAAQRVAVQDAPPLHQFVTSRAQRAMVTLDDGTQVVLGVDSKLTVAQGFAVSSRQVVIDGQAYFTIAPDARLPFMVTAGQTVTRVLGTTFAIRKYATDTDVHIAVV